MISLRYNDKLLGLFVLSYLLVDMSFGQMKLAKSSKFPIHIENTFRISFSQKKSPNNALIIDILKNRELIYHDIIFYTLLSKYEVNNNEYVSFNYYTSGETITLNLKFKRNANKLILRFRYIGATTQEEFQSKIQNFNANQVIYDETIKLKMPPILYLTMMTSDKNQAALAAGRTVDINCTAKGGFPEVKPYISFPHKMYGKVFNNKAGNELEVHKTYIAHIKDHGHYVYCNAGSKRKTHTIKIYHHPSYITFDPAYTTRMPNGSTVRCLSDGYPLPNIKWEFLSGPKDADNYYAIEGDKLTLKSNAPLNSKWSFNCSAMNTNSQDKTGGTLRTFEFSVIPLINKALWISIIGGCILLILVIMIAIYFIYKKFFRKNAPHIDNTIEMSNSLNQNKSYFQYHDQNHYNQEESTSPTVKKKNHKKTKPSKKTQHYDEDDGNEEMIV